MKIVKILIGLVVLLVLAVVLVRVFAGAIAKTAVEKVGTYAFGTETKVKEVDIGILKGMVAMERFSVANPEGYGGGKFLEIGTGWIAVTNSSLRSEKVEVPRLDLSEIHLSLVQGTKGSNYGTILDRLKRLQRKDDGSGGGGDSGEKDPSAGKRFVIEKLVLADIVVDLVPVPELGLAAVSIPIRKIHLSDVGTDSDKGVLLSELAGIVLEAILTQATATGQLPSLVQGALEGQLGQLHGLADAGVQGLEGFLPEGAKGGVDAAKEALGEGLRGLGIGR